MTSSFVKFSCLLLVASGCATTSARFKTSDAPRDEPNEDQPLQDYQVPAESLAAPRYKNEVTTTRFLLALQNRSPEQLENLLLPGAIVREETSASGNAALPFLLDLSSTWSLLREAEPGGADTSVQAFGPSHVIDLQTQGSETWATVEVDGPPKVRGLWRIRLDGGSEIPKVAEVVLPKGN